MNKQQSTAETSKPDLLGFATKKSDELVDEFCSKSQQLEGRYRQQLLNDVKLAKSNLMKEIAEHLRMVDAADPKADVAVNLRRIGYQCRAFKKSVESRLEIDQLSGHLKLKSPLHKAFESNINQNEINELYELISKMDVKSFFDLENTTAATAEQPDADKGTDKAADKTSMKEPASIRSLVKGFEQKGKETIEAIRTSLGKSATAFQNEVMQLKAEIDKADCESNRSPDEAPKCLKSEKSPTLKADADRELKRILASLAKVGQCDRIRYCRRQLTANKKTYLNELKKSDCALSVQCLEHIWTLKRRLWHKFILIFGELVELIATTPADAEKSFKNDALLMKSLNECVERTMKNCDAFIGKTADQRLEVASKRLKELNEQFTEELRGGKRMNKLK